MDEPQKRWEGGEASDSAGSIREKVIEQLRTVFDPEIPVDVYELGLVCDIQIDRQVSCDGGQTFVDVGFDDEPISEICSTLDSGLVQVQWVGVNNSTIGQQTANVSCTLEDGNGNFQTFVMNANDPIDTPTVLAMSTPAECSTVFAAGEDAGRGGLFRRVVGGRRAGPAAIPPSRR